MLDITNQILNFSKSQLMKCYKLFSYILRTPQIYQVKTWVKYYKRYQCRYPKVSILGSAVSLQMFKFCCFMSLKSKSYNFISQLVITTLKLYYIKLTQFPRKSVITSELHNEVSIGA